MGSISQKKSLPQKSSDFRGSDKTSSN